MDTKELRQKILDLAIRGKLVPQDPNDEPASVLLQRIREEKERLVKEGKIKEGKKAKASETPQNPYLLPKGWEWCKLEDIAYVASGSTPAKEYFVPKGIPFIKMYNLRSQQIDFDFKPQYITEEVHNGKLQRSRTEVGDLIMNIVGPPLGKLAIIPPTLPQANFNQAAVLIRPYLHKDVINHYLKSYLEEMSEINSITTRGCAGQVNISLSQSQKMRIPLPPLAEQRRIVSEIERWLSLIDIIESGKENLKSAVKQAKAKILDLAIHGKLVPQDPNDEPASQLLHRINPKAEISSDNEQYGEVPKGWCVCHINEISESLLGKTLDKSKDQGELKPYLCAVNVQWGHFDLTTQKAFRIENKDFDRYAVRKGDLLVCEGGDVGRSAIWNSSTEMYYQNALHRIRCKQCISVEYLLYTFWHFKLSGAIDALCKGVTIKHFTQFAMNKLPIPLPPLAEQYRIVARIEQLFAQLDRIEAKL